MREPSLEIICFFRIRDEILSSFIREWFLLILRGDGEGFCIKIGTIGLGVLPDSYTKLTVCNANKTLRDSKV